MSRILCVDNIIRVLPGGTRLISPLSFEGSSGESIFVQASDTVKRCLTFSAAFPSRTPVVSCFVEKTSMTGQRKKRLNFDAVI